MHQMRNGDTGEFPRFGARARTWHRFECELTRWLESPDGRFAQWRARRAISDGDHISVPSADPGPADRY